MEHAAGATLYTIGYEGRAVEDFIEDLRFADVEVLVDVRELPHSRRPGFSKSKLSEHVSRAGLEYLHLRSLGSPVILAGGLGRAATSAHSPKNTLTT